MWWLGSLPCAYMPTRPATSGGVSGGRSVDWAKSASSCATKASRPPNSSMYPFKSCWLAKVACQAFDSVKSRHFFMMLISFGSNGSGPPPFLQARAHEGDLLGEQVGVVLGALRQEAGIPFGSSRAGDARRRPIVV